MIKRWIALLMATALLFTLGACKKKEETPSIPVNPGTAEEAATNFIRAYRLEDYLTFFSLYLHDARQEWIDNKLVSQTVDEYLAAAQAQADKEGMSVTLQSLDDYYIALHEKWLARMDELYGAYTITSKVTSSVKLDEAGLEKLIGEVGGGFTGKYVTEEQLNNITEGYIITVDFTIAGELKEFHDIYTVKTVLCDGKWLVAGHTT